MDLRPLLSGAQPYFTLSSSVGRMHLREIPKTPSTPVPPPLLQQSHDKMGEKTCAKPALLVTMSQGSWNPFSVLLESKYNSIEIFPWNVSDVKLSHSM